ncbi:hypothetical protein BAJUN_01570 [Bajunvirus bajun]|uniref:Uncharacterized protein n=1 Tax=Brevundimonas phage vB_BgoS-Bajun TaxID=2948594 RepID=A0A9E7N7B0_9CAUD|nr:hypothetical protein BAJUN_01570 [Brevundimonas phage vB_BgoS-Bajun]
MPRYVLRPVAANDPRPTVTHPAVANLAIDGHMPALVEWTKTRLPVDEDMIRFAVGMALKAGGLDGFRIASHLRDVFSWPANDELTAILKQVTGALNTACDVIAGQWVLRTGIRFPGKVGDTVEFVAVDGSIQVGVVTDMLKLRAMGYVTLGGEENYLVPAEAVVGNVTTSTYATQRPILGMRYEDAPALAAAYEAERAAIRRAHQPLTVEEQEVADMMRDENVYIEIEGDPDFPGPSAA